MRYGISELFPSRVHFTPIGTMEPCQRSAVFLRLISWESLSPDYFYTVFFFPINEKKWVNLLYLKFQHSSKRLRIWLKQATFCFVCVCVYRVNKLATSELKVRALNSLYLKAQNIKQNQNQNMNIPRTSERTVTFNLHDTAAIKFNTGVSIFTKNTKCVWLGCKIFTLVLSNP